MKQTAKKVTNKIIHKGEMDVEEDEMCLEF